jgi:hypothetical protein
LSFFDWLLRSAITSSRLLSRPSASATALRRGFCPVRSLAALIHDGCDLRLASVA